MYARRQVLARHKAVTTMNEFFFTYVYRALTIDFQFIKAVSTVYRAVTIFLSETVYKAVTIVHVYIRLYVRYYRAGQLCIQSSDNSFFENCIQSSDKCTYTLLGVYPLYVMCYDCV